MEQLKKDDPVAVQHYQRLKEQRENEERKSLNEITETWYTLNGQKLLRLRRKKSGTVVSDLVGHITDKETKALFETYKAKGLLRY